jgi:hypothetical protein
MEDRCNCAAHHAKVPKLPNQFRDPSAGAMRNKAFELSIDWIKIRQKAPLNLTQGAGRSKVMGEYS